MPAVKLKVLKLLCLALSVVKMVLRIFYTKRDAEAALGKKPSKRKVKKCRPS